MAHSLDENEKRIVELFRQHTQLFLDIDPNGLGSLVDIALKEESGLTELSMLSKRNQEGDRELITDVLNRIKSNEQTSKIFNTVMSYGFTVKYGSISVVTRLLTSGDIDNIKLLLSISPIGIEFIQQMDRYPMISIVFLVNFYPDVIPRKYNRSTRNLGVNVNRVKKMLANTGYIIGLLKQDSLPSLAEVCLRQCRRDRVDLSALPFSLVCINPDI